MENIKIKPLSPEEIAVEEKKTASSAWRFLIVICIILVGLALFFFFWKQPICYFDEKIDHELFGTFGDFVGGFIGTVVAVFSVYFLVQTLRKQIDSNAETTKSNRKLIESNEKLLALNNLQLFDNQFQLLYRQYLIAVENYQEGNLHGRKALEEKVKGFLSTTFNNAQEYKRRSMAAVDNFKDFYATNRVECSVHFRLLYLLVCLIAEADIEEENQVMYAKSIRGQLSEGELVIIRYNCLTDNGMKMKQFVNQYNLLKHLPLMSIFEFREWKDIILKDELLSALDTMFIALKKGLTNLNDVDDFSEYCYDISSRYSFKYRFDDEHKSLTLTVFQQKVHKTGGGIKRPLGEKALDCLNGTQLQDLFYAFLHEAFITGSFGLYNDKEECRLEQPKIIIDDLTQLVFSINVTKSTRLVLAERQVVPGT